MKARSTERTARLVATAVIVVLLALSLAGCGGQPAASGGSNAPAKAATNGFPVTITDDASRTVTIATRPTRIVSLAPANTEILYSLGLIGEVVGVTTYDDYPPQVKSIAKVGDFQTPNLEAIAAARPDVVFVTGGVQASVIAKLSQIGAKVVVIDPQSLAGVSQSILKVARVTGTLAQGQKVVTDMNTTIVNVRDKLAGATPVPCFIEIGYDPLYTAGSGTLLNDLITAAGGVNVVNQAGYVGFSVEQLVKDQPAVYLGTRSSLGTTAAVAARPGYSALSAVKDGRVFVLDDDLVSRPGPRIAQGLLEIAKALHPLEMSRP